MRALKTIVVVLSVILIAAFGLLIFGLTQNWHRASDKAVASGASAEPRPSAMTAAAPAPAVTGAAAVRDWTLASLGQPPGAQVQGIVAAGDLVIVHVTTPIGDHERLVVVDPARGKVVGAFTVSDP